MAWNASHINHFYVMFIVLFLYFEAWQPQSWFNFIEKKQWVSEWVFRKKVTWVHKGCHNFFSFLSKLSLSLGDSLNRECLVLTVNREQFKWAELWDVRNKHPDTIILNFKGFHTIHSFFLSFEGCGLCYRWRFHARGDFTNTSHAVSEFISTGLCEDIVKTLSKHSSSSRSLWWLQRCNFSVPWPRRPKHDCHYSWLPGGGTEWNFYSAPESPLSLQEKR